MDHLSIKEVLKFPVMRRVWYAQMVSAFGDFLALYAIISVVAFKMHATAAQITWVQISYLLPMVLTGPFVGVFVDRWPVKPVLIGSDLIRAALSLLLLLATQLWHFYVILACLSMVSSFFLPAQTLAVQSSVPKEGLLSANSVMQQVAVAMRIVGPGLAGVLVASFGANSCYLIDTISFFASSAFIFSVVINRPVPTATPGSRSESTGIKRVYEELNEGMIFLFKHPTISFIVAALAAALFAIGCFGPLIAVYLRDNLQVNAKVFGLSSAMIGVGLIAGSNLLRRIAKRISGIKLILYGLVGIAAFLILLSAWPILPITFISTFGIGFSVAAIVIPSQSFIQLETPANLMGRIGSSVQSVVGGAQVLGLILSGALAHFTSVRFVFVICACLLIMVALVGGIGKRKHF